MTHICELAYKFCYITNKLHGIPSDRFVGEGVTPLWFRQPPGFNWPPSSLVKKYSAAHSGFTTKLSLVYTMYVKQRYAIYAETRI